MTNCFRHRLAASLLFFGAFAGGCASDDDSAPTTDTMEENLAAGGDSATGVESGSGGSSATGDSLASCGSGVGAGGSGSGSPAVCNTLTNLSSDVRTTTDPGPPPTMIGGTLVDGTYVLTSVVTYETTSIETVTYSDTIVITGGTTLQGVSTENGGPDMHYTITLAPSGNHANSIERCPTVRAHYGSPGQQDLYTATATTFAVMPVDNLVITYSRL